MKREYDVGSKEHVEVFVGIEVEHTIMYGTKTLFVVGLHRINDLVELAREHQCKHIYLGANQSFDGKNIFEWESLAKDLLDEGYWVTLDVNVGIVGCLTGSALNSYGRFIPMISVKIPWIQSLNPNASIKIDDIDFNRTNPGIWCHQLRDLKDSNKFTEWDQYSSDTIIK